MEQHNVSKMDQHQTARPSAINSHKIPTRIPMLQPVLPLTQPHTYFETHIEHFRRANRRPIGSWANRCVCSFTERSVSVLFHLACHPALTFLKSQKSQKEHAMGRVRCLRLVLTLLRSSWKETYRRPRVQRKATFDRNLLYVAYMLQK